MELYKIIKKTLLVFSLILSLNIYSQGSYINYHKQIIYAEELFVHSNFRGSLASYISIFDQNNFYFLKDCINALQIACYLKDKKTAELLFQKAYLKGLKHDKLKNYYYINDYLLFNNINPDIQFKEFNLTYIEGIDFSLRAELNILKKTNEAYIFASRFNKKFPTEEKLISTRNENWKRFINWIRVNGYPSEHNIGIADEEMDLIKTKRIAEDMVEQLYNNNVELYFCTKDKLEEALKIGNLCPRKFAQYYENAYWAKEKTQLNVKYMDICDAPVKSKFYNTIDNNINNSFNINLVDNDRFEIGLGTLKHDSHLRDFMSKTKFTVVLY
jgi:hypothetical protein